MKVKNVGEAKQISKEICDAIEYLLQESGYPKNCKMNEIQKYFEKVRFIKDGCN